MKTRKLFLSIFACGAVALTFSTTTYAWFRIGSSGYVNNLDFKVISGLGFKIAADGSDSSYYTDELNSKLMKSAIVHGYNPDKYVFYKNELYEYTPGYEQGELVEEKFKLVDESEMDLIIKEIKLDLATTMVNKGNEIQSDGFTLYNEYGDLITDKKKFLEFDLYFKADSDLATDNQHFGIYLTDDTTYNPYGDSRKDEDGNPYSAPMTPTQITSKSQAVKLVNELKYMEEKTYDVKELKAKDEINVSLANAIRFSVKDNGEVEVTPKSENQSKNKYTLDDNNSFIVKREEGVNTYTSILPNMNATPNSRTDTQARIYEIANEGNLGSYATNYSGEDKEITRLYNSEYSAMYTYYQSLGAASDDVKPLDYGALKKMYDDGLIYNKFNENQITTILDSGLKAHKITFRFWLEGYDADYFAGVSGLESLSCSLSFKVNSKYN